MPDEEKMRVVVATEAGGPEVLQAEERPRPEPSGDEVLVRVEAANVNPTDLGAREGNYPPDMGIEGPPYVLGWDFAGEVCALGEGVSGFELGDAVVGMIPWYEEGGRRGAYTEFVVASSDWLVLRPDRLLAVEAATIPLNGLTACEALNRLGVSGGDELLVIGASGAVGAFAVQLACRRGAEVTAVAGGDDEDWVASLGADRVIPRDEPLDSIGHFALVLDAVPVGAPAFPAIADGGKVLSTRPVDDDPERGIEQISMLVEPDRKALADLVAMAADGELRTRVAETVPLADASEAHRLSERSGHHGKSVLVP